MPERPVQAVALLVACTALAALAFVAGHLEGGRHAAVVLVGALAGLGLYHAGFGFTSAWRRLVVERKGRDVRAQVLLLLVAAGFTFPLLARGDEVGVVVHGFVFPFGLSAAIGAFLFGIGMQFGGGCASGTLFTVGGGTTRMLVTLAAFIAGSVWATAHMSFWWQLPALPALSLVDAVGPWAAWFLTALALGSLALATRRLERDAHGTLEPGWTAGGGAGRQALWWRGPWSPEVGALVLALVCVLALVVLGRPWGITSGFALWGAKVLAGLDVHVETWAYWQGQQRVLDASVLRDGTSVMNFGIVLGALAAASLAGRFAPVWRLSAAQLATAVVGGLLMGYGARLAYGCNIGAYVGGVLSGSLHGWLWLVFGFAGSSLALYLKRRMGL